MLYVQMCIFLLLLFASFQITQAQFVQIHGMTARCSNEGQLVDISEYTLGYTVDDPCIQCYCLNGHVQCMRERCAELEWCPVLQAVTPTNTPTNHINNGNMSSPSLSRSTRTECCAQKCRTCVYAGIQYKNDERWMSTQDACRMFLCKAGVVTTARVQCARLCEHPVHVAGYCCPLCPQSITHNLLSVDMPSVSETMAVVGVSCVWCSCDGGLCQCYRGACAVLDCDPADQYVPPDQCCAQCRTQTTALLHTTAHCSFQGDYYDHEQSFRPDKCTLCKCQDGLVLCKRFVCPVMECPPQRQYYDPRVCCPFCTDRDPAPCNTSQGPQPHGSSWSEDVCTSCTCSNGEQKCTHKQCADNNRCADGYTAKRVSGQCCVQCIQNDATCSVMGDPNYRTFDGLKFSFQGTCRYLFAQTCYTPQYTPLKSGDKRSLRVIVRNAPHSDNKNNQNNHTTSGKHKPNTRRKHKQHVWTKSVVIDLRLPDTAQRYKIVLMKRKVGLAGFCAVLWEFSLRVKVNGRRVLRVPHIQLGVFSIQHERAHNRLLIRVHAPEPVSASWDGQGHFELHVAPSMKGRLCGLCGDYNDRPADDTRLPNTQMAHGIHQFAQAWRTNSWRKCILKKDQQYHLQRKLDRRKERKAQAYLRKLTAWKMLNGIR